jgi:ABC-type branched-subunit amino acid transport system permease subunit
VSFIGSDAETVRRFTTLIEVRRKRLQHVTTALPGEFWVGVAVGAALGIILTWLYSIRRLSLHLAVAAILSLFTGLVVFLIAAMDNSYRGKVGVSPEPFEIVQRPLMAPAPQAPESLGAQPP